MKLLTWTINCDFFQNIDHSQDIPIQNITIYEMSYLCDNNYQRGGGGEGGGQLHSYLFTLYDLFVHFQLAAPLTVCLLDDSYFKFTYIRVTVVVLKLKVGQVKGEER